MNHSRYDGSLLTGQLTGASAPRMEVLIRRVLPYQMEEARMRFNTSIWVLRSPPQHS